MTGFQSTPRVCPSDTLKLGFSYIRSSSLSVFSLSVNLSSSQLLTVTPAVCFYLNGENVCWLSRKGRIWEMFDST